MSASKATEVHAAAASGGVHGLRSKVLSGLLWAGGARLAGQVLTWAISIAVMRVLVPADYGLIAMATVFVGFVHLLAEAGLGAAIVQAKDIDEERLRRAFGAVIVVDAVLFTVQYAAAPVVAHFFREPRLVPIIRVLSLHFLILMFSAIPVALLTRKMDFKRQSMIDALSAVCGSLSTLSLALSGWGVWAIVVGNLVSHGCNTLGINLLAPYLRRPEFSLAGLRGMMTYGGQVSASRVLWFFYSQADVFIAGRFLGKELLGSYAVAMQLASLPVQKLSVIINRVAFPAFAQAQHETAAVPQYLMKGVRTLSFLAFPVLWGISSVAPEIVRVLLGEKWLGAILPLQLLALVMPLSMLSPFFNTAFQGIGKAGVVFRNVLTASLLMPLAFGIGVQWGLAGLSIAWIATFPVVFGLNMHRMLPLVGLTLKDLLQALAPSVMASGAMYAAVAGMRAVAAEHMAPAPLMVVLVATGVAAYVLMAFAVNRKGVREMAELLVRRKAAAQPIASAVS